MNNDQDYFNLMSCIALLEQHLKVHYFSLLLTISAITTIIIDVQNVSFLLISLCSSLIIIGAIELICAVRIGFDQKLLALLSKEMNVRNKKASESLMSLEHSLKLMNLIPSNSEHHSLNKRLLGCIRLFKKQAVLCSLQVILMAGIIIFW